MSALSPPPAVARPPGHLSALRRDLREMVAELVQYRELLFTLMQRDLLLRYKQTVMGFAWAVLMPVTYMVVFSVIFTRVVPLETPVPYPVFAYAGLLPWNLFASSLRFSVNALVANSTLVTKVYFPREILPFSVILVSLVDFLVGSLVLALLMLHYGIPAGPSLLFAPVILLVQLAFTAGVTLLVSMGNLFYRDVKYLLEIGLTRWMFSTSVVYPVDRVGGTAGRLLALNPMTPIVDAWRAVALESRLPDAGPFIYAAVVAAVVLAASWILFHRAEHRFAENV